MYQIDKEKFGTFVANLRKEKQLTQKELAEKLFLSDKAISKWERGLSMPDITILTPLADILGVTVAELLQCERLPQSSMQQQQVEELVQKAIGLGEEKNLGKELWKRPLHWLVLLGTWVVVAVEWMTLLWLKYDPQAMGFEMQTFLLLPALFGCFVWLLIQERLPAYYDENQIRYYHHNGFKMNIPGVNLNNSNWPYIVKALRCWTVYLPISVPLIYGAGHWLLLQKGLGILWLDRSLIFWILLFWSLLSLFLPLVYVGKKYE